MSPETQDFHISVTPLTSSDTYLVRTEKVTPGVPLAEEQVKWPIEHWLDQFKILMNDPDIKSSENLINLGKELYQNLFTGSIRDSWIIAQAIAHNHNTVLRLRLGLKGSLLPQLPWEILHDLDRPLTTGTDLAFSRYLLAPLRRQFNIIETGKSSAINILIALDSSHNKKQLYQELQDLEIELNHLQLEILDNPDATELTQILEMGNYQIFHYIGNITETLISEDLAGLLVNNGVKLAVFNSFKATDTLLNISNTLITRGMPAILGITDHISNEAELTLIRLFYRNLNQGYPIDLSLNRARQGLISAFGSKQLYWTLPLLYLQPQFDGFFLSKNEQQYLDDIDDHLLTQSNLVDDFSIGLEDHHFQVDYDDNYADDYAVVSELFKKVAQSDNMIQTQDILSDSLAKNSIESGEIVQEKQIYLENKKSKPWPLIILFTTGIITIVMGIIWFWLNQNNSKNNAIPSSTNINIVPKQKTNFTKDNSGNLTTFAMDRFRENDVKTGILVVEELLKPERSALTNAETVLNSLSEKQKYQPEIMFLWGRIAWQSIQTGNNKYSINDVQRYWEFCLKNDNKSVIYLNALGFVYYEQKFYEKANKIWFKALSLHNKNTSEIDVLNSYAGLALGLKQLSLQTKDKERKEKLLNESNKLYEKVITDEPVKFQPNELSRNNWLWTEKMIKDWGKLGKKD